MARKEAFEVLDMWTQFWDMHSGGSTKEPPYDKIYVELPKEQAIVWFYNRFGHSPYRVTCTCCGEDYSLYEDPSLAQITGYHRNLRYIEKGKAYRYLEPGKEVPEGWKITNISAGRSMEGQLTIEEYEAREDVLIVRRSEVEDSQLKGEVPQQGYIWQD